MLTEDIAEYSNERSADFSPDRIYRYALYRYWDRQKPYVLFIGLNPSTADELQDDPTIRRCIRFAKSWGMGGLVMCNLFAFRATDPNEMMKADDPVGPDNDIMLRQLSEAAKLVVAAWGTCGRYKNRNTCVRDLLNVNLMCLGTTKDGSPKHPLYLRKDTELELLADRVVVCHDGLPAGRRR